MKINEKNYYLKYYFEKILSNKILYTVIKYF